MAVGDAGNGRDPAIGDSYEVTADRLNDDGDGVARADGWTVFVPDLLPGERARIRVTARERQFLRADVAERLTDAEERLTPACPVFGACGGCQLQHLTYAAQLAHKQRVVQETLARVAKLPDVPVLPPLGMARPWRYRNQVQVPLEVAPESHAGPAVAAPGRLRTGFFARGSHRIVHSATCELEPTAMEQTVAAAAEVITQELGARAAAVHHLIVRESHATGDIMLVMAVGDAGIDISRVAHRLMALPQVVSVARTVQPRTGGPVWGKSVEVIAGAPNLSERLLGIEYLISPRSFFQVNTEQAEVLVQTALAYAQPTGADEVLDAYCGTGSISLPLAKHAHRVTGIESVSASIADARRNAEHNGIHNAAFHVGQVERVLPELIAQGQHFDIAVLDPPRRGCERPVLDALVNARIPRVVYVSCNHATLARDLRILVDGGYQVEEVQPVDMFPQTSHVECCSLLIRKE